MKPLIHIDDTQIHIDDEHYTLFIRFKQEKIQVKEPSPPPRYLPETITVIREGDKTNSLHKKHVTDKLRKCVVCKATFKPTSNRQKCCPDHLTRNPIKKKQDLDSTLKEIEEKRKKPYQVTPPVV